jgi:hypothetical protein
MAPTSMGLVLLRLNHVRAPKQPLSHPPSRPRRESNYFLRNLHMLTEVSYFLVFEDFELR